MTSTEQKTPWGRIAGVSLGVLAAALVIAFFWRAGFWGLTSSQFFLGMAAGVLGRRQGWLAGIIVGVPYGLAQLTFSALEETESWGLIFSQGDYWRLAVPAGVVSVGLAISGGILGTWIEPSRWKKH